MFRKIVIFMFGSFAAAMFYDVPERIIDVNYGNFSGENCVLPHQVRANDAFTSIWMHVSQHVTGYFRLVQGPRTVEQKADLDLSQPVITITVVKLTLEEKLAQYDFVTDREFDYIQLTPFGPALMISVFGKQIHAQASNIKFVILKTSSPECVIKALEACQGAVINASLEDSKVLSITDHDKTSYEEWLEKTKVVYERLPDGFFSRTVSLGHGVQLKFDKTRRDDISTQFFKDLIYNPMHIFLNGSKICTMWISTNPKERHSAIHFIKNYLVRTLTGQAPEAVADAGAA